jgi:hypothetical protein
MLAPGFKPQNCKFSTGLRAASRDFSSAERQSPAMTSLKTGSFGVAALALVAASALVTISALGAAKLATIEAKITCLSNRIFIETPHVLEYWPTGMTGKG